MAALQVCTAAFSTKAIATETTATTVTVNVFCDMHWSCCCYGALDARDCDLWLRVSKLVRLYNAKATLPADDQEKAVFAVQ